MKKLLSYILFFSAVTFLSCEKNVNLPEDFPIMKFSISGLSGNTFNIDDTISVFIYHTNLLNKDNIENNLICQIDENFSIKPPVAEIKYPEGKSELDVLAFYPYVKSGFKENSTKIDVLYNTQQNTYDGYKKSDFLVSNLKAKKTNSQQDLLFYHKMSQIVMRIKGGDSFTDLNELNIDEIIIKNLITKAEYDFSSNLFSLSENYGDVTPNGILSADEDGYLSGLKAVVIPQTIPSGTKLFEIRIKDAKYYYTTQNEIKLLSSQSKLFSLTIHKNSVVLEDEISIQEWEQTSNPSLESGYNKLEINFDNTFPIVDKADLEITFKDNTTQSFSMQTVTNNTVKLNNISQIISNISSIKCTANGTDYIFYVYNLNSKSIKLNTLFSGKGDGSEAFPFEIVRGQNFVNIKNNLNSYYVQVNDIKLPESFLPIEFFGGNYNGANFKIQLPQNLNNNPSNKLEDVFKNYSGIIRFTTIEILP